MSSCTKTEGWLLGKQRQLETQKRQKAARIAEYNRNPKFCKQCNTALTYEDNQRSKAFCSRVCSATFNNTLRGKTKIVECTCGNTFSIRQFQKKKYCNSKCAAVDRANKALNTSIELFKQGKLTDVSRDRIKKSMVMLGVEKQCALCGIKDWLGKPIPFILDHINGDSSNNKLSNLRLLCSNCDSQTPHYKGRNKGFGRSSLKNK
jgi:5-methylcytosine-specific restriction endonuclease McrA